MKVAAAAWPLEWHPDFDAYALKLEAWVAEAAAAGASLAMFPEYGGLEAAFTGARPQNLTPADWLPRAAAVAPDRLALHARLATRHGLTLLAGSAPHPTPRGFVNRAHLFTPEGGVGHQDKQILTPWERANTPLVPGDPLSVFDTPAGRVAVLICYDSEFPLLARALSADLLLVPSCTDALTGVARIRTAALARALEGRRHVLTCATLGRVPECVILDRNAGRAGLYAPADRGFCENGVVAETAPDARGWLIAEFDTGPRPIGEVNIPAHWREQDEAAARVEHRPMGRLEMMP